MLTVLSAKSENIQICCQWLLADILYYMYLDPPFFQTSLHYKSGLLRTLETIVFSPLFLFGYMEQKQFLHIELFPDYLDNAVSMDQIVTYID